MRTVAGARKRRPDLGLLLENPEAPAKGGECSSGWATTLMGGCEESGLVCLGPEGSVAFSVSRCQDVLI